MSADCRLDRTDAVGVAVPGRGRSRAVLIATSVVVAAGFGLRFWAPGALWLDEAQSVAIAQLPIRGGMGAALREDGAPPLFYVLLHIWMGWFGSTDLAVRSLCGVLSVAALPLAWLAGIRFGGTRWAGRVALLLTATNPWMLRYATEARMYALLVLLVLAGALILDTVRRRPTLVAGGALAAVSGALMLTHYWSFFLLAVVVGGLLVSRLRGAGGWTVHAIAAIAVGALFFLPWMPSFVFQLRHTGTPWAARATLGDLARLPQQWAGSSPLLTLALGALMILGLRGARRTGPAPVLAVAVVGTVALAWGAAAAGMGAFASRYTGVVVPLALLVAALGVTALRVRYGAAVLALVSLLGLAIGVRHQPDSRTQAAAVARALGASSDPGDVVAFCPDQLGPAVTRVLAQRRITGLRLLTYPTAGSPARVDWVDYASRNAGGQVADFADRLDRDATAARQIFLVQAPGRYRTYGSACTRIASRLDARRGTHQVLVSPSRGSFEKMRLLVWTGTHAARPGPAGPSANGPREPAGLRFEHR